MSDKKYAFSTMTIKAMDDTPGGKRTFKGIASTPTVDRTGDIVEPKGAKFTLPIPLCWQHDTHDPVGWVTSAKVTDKGIEIEGEFAQVQEPLSLKDRLDTAWSMVKNKLVQGLSIGFKPLEYSRIEDTYSYRYLSWLWLELSPVTVPANGDCSITSIKALDEAVRKAAFGVQRIVRLDDSPGVPGTVGSKAAVSGANLSFKGMNMKTLTEQLAAFEAKRKGLMERKSEIVQKSLDEGRVLDDAEREENDTITADVKSIDDHIKTLKEHEKFLIKSAAPVDTGAGGDNPQGSSVDLGGGRRISVTRNLPKGTGYTRFAMALACGKGNIMQAEQIVLNQIKKGVWANTPELETIMKAAVAAGSTSDATWAAPLVQYQELASEFIELVRPQTILGRMTQLRRVPFNVRIPRQTAGTSGAFVGEGAPAPVQKLSFDNITLPWAKASTIVVLTVELARLSDPSAEALVRQDLIDGTAQFLDRRLIDPVYAGVANVSPASLSYGVVARQASGSSLAAIDDDVQAVMQAFVDNDLGLDSGVWVMSPSMALRLSLMRTNQDTRAFPELTMNGGTWYGLPVTTSNNVVASASPGESQIFLINQKEVFLADDGQMTLDVSTEASLQMDGAPSAGAQSLVSLWQNGLMGVKIDRWIYWMKRRAQALQFIEQAQKYGT